MGAAGTKTGVLTYYLEDLSPNDSVFSQLVSVIRRLITSGEVQLHSLKPVRDGGYVLLLLHATVSHSTWKAECRLTKRVHSGRALSVDKPFEHGEECVTFTTHGYAVVARRPVLPYPAPELEEAVFGALATRIWETTWIRLALGELRPQAAEPVALSG